MIVLRDEVEIGAPPERAFAFLSRIDLHYTDWHPNHRGAEWVEGQPGEAGAVLAVEEVLHGKLHRLRLRITAVRPGREIRYRIGPGARGAFRFARLNGGVRFAAELTFGWNRPLLSRLLDPMLARLLGKRLEALRRHMEEEGRNLKALLERRSVS